MDTNTQNADAQGGKTVRLLWTGGWDSTFRLLMLAANENVRVELIYVYNVERESRQAELAAMQAVLELIYQRFPGSEARLSVLHQFNQHEIPQDQDIREKHNHLRGMGSFGTQYPVLAELALAQGWDDVEMGIVRIEGGAVFEGLTANTIRVDEAIIGSTYRLLPDIDPASPYTLFQRFSFPLLHMSKLDIKAAAEANGWLDIMAKTWFCHKPVKGKPCGLCAPCRDAYKEGMRDRLPAMAKVRYRFPTIAKGVRLLKREGFRALVRRAGEKLRTGK